MNLQTQLEQFSRSAANDIPADVMEILHTAAQSLQHSYLLENAVKNGEIIEDFTLTDATGTPLSLKKLLQSGPVVLSFYRGAWCPFCNIELNALQKILPDIQAQGATLVAISPQLPDKSLTMSEKLALDFHVLSDIGNELARRFGLVYSLDETLVPIFIKWGIDLGEYNGDKSDELPIPSTLIVDRKRTVVYAYHNTDHSKRMEPREILSKLEEIQR